MLQEQRADAPETSVAKVVKTPQSGSVAQAIASLKDEAAQTVVTPEKDIAQMLQNVMAQQHEEIPEREVTPQPKATTEPEATTQASASQAETTPPAEKTAASPTPTQQHQARLRLHTSIRSRLRLRTTKPSIPPTCADAPPHPTDSLQRSICRIRWQVQIV